MAIIIEDREFDPGLKTRIAAFIDEFFQEDDYQDWLFEGQSFSAAMPAPAAMPAAAAMPAPAAMPESAAAPKPKDKPEKTAAFGSSFGLRKAVYEADSALEETSDLQSWLDQVDEPFSTTLLALIDRRGLNDVDVYKRAHMSRQLFSRIRGDASYRPAKKTVLALAIALELSLDETRDLLSRAGFALSHASKRDLIVEYFVSNGMYDLFAINEALYEFDQPLI